MTPIVVTEMWADLETNELVMEKKIEGWYFVPTANPGRPKKKREYLPEMITNPTSFRQVMPKGLEIDRLTCLGKEIR